MIIINKFDNDNRKINNVMYITESINIDSLSSQFKSILFNSIELLIMGTILQLLKLNTMLMKIHLKFQKKIAYMLVKCYCIQ